MVNKEEIKEEGFTHLDEQGHARMVNVGDKPVTSRRAVAEAWVQLGSEVAQRVKQDGGLAKGRVIDTARIAGILGAKQIPQLIPLCHSLALDVVDVRFELSKNRLRIVGEVCTEARTGVEMEAMGAVTIAALTVYDMVKSATKGVVLGPIRLLEKSGGRSGHWKCEESHDGTN